MTDHQSQTFVPSSQHLQFMARAAELSLENVGSGNGGPFGCVIVKDGQIIAEGSNQVLRTQDPTAHAEVVAIRRACEVLGSFQLTGCEVYTSCEPCPMCLGALYWARPAVIYYANTKADAAAIGFDDQFIYDELDCKMSDRKLPIIRLMVPIAPQAFEAWANKQDRVDY